MIGWLEMCARTRVKLNRELEDRELDFLKWVYTKYKLESEAQETSRDTVEK